LCLVHLVIEYLTFSVFEGILNPLLLAFPLV